MHPELRRPFLTGNDLIGQQVGIGNPADLIGEVLVVASEIGGAPAMEGSTHILSSTDEHGEHE